MGAVALPELLGVQLYALEGEDIKWAKLGSLMLTTSIMTGYRARFVPEDGSDPVVWMVPDATPILRFPDGLYVFPTKGPIAGLFYIINLPDASKQQLWQLDQVLDARCALFRLDSMELTDEALTAQLANLAKSARYNSRIARSVSNTSVRLANGISSVREELLKRMSSSRAFALERLSSKEVAVDKECLQLVQGIADASSVAHKAVDTTLGFIVAPIKQGVMFSFKQGKNAVAAVRRLNEGKAAAPPRLQRCSDSPAAGDEVLAALKLAFGEVVGAAVSNGKALASSGSSAVNDVVSHAFGQQVAELGHEGVFALVKTLKAVAAVKTFGGLRLAKHTAQKTVKHVAQSKFDGGGGGAGGVGVLVVMRVETRGGHEHVSVSIREDDRLVAVSLHPMRTLLPAAAQSGGSRVVKVKVSMRVLVDEDIFGGRLNRRKRPDLSGFSAAEASFNQQLQCALAQHDQTTPVPQNGASLRSNSSVGVGAVASPAVGLRRLSASAVPERASLAAASAPGGKDVAAAEGSWGGTMASPRRVSSQQQIMRNRSAEQLASLRAGR